MLAAVGLNGEKNKCRYFPPGDHISSQCLLLQFAVGETAHVKQLTMQSAANPLGVKFSACFCMSGLAKYGQHILRWGGNMSQSYFTHGLHFIYLPNQFSKMDSFVG